MSVNTIGLICFQRHYHNNYPEPIHCVHVLRRVARHQMSTRTRSTIKISYYGAPQTQTSLGDIEVERDIHRLRDLLSQVDKCLERCYNAINDIGEIGSSRATVQMSIFEEF